MTRHPARIISDAHKELGDAQDGIRSRGHKKTLKKVRQELNKILDVRSFGGKKGKTLGTTS